MAGPEGGNREVAQNADATKIEGPKKGPKMSFKEMMDQRIRENPDFFKNMEKSQEEDRGRAEAALQQMS